MSESRRYDVQFHFDPVCPFAWITSRWVTKVAERRGYDVDWQFISLRLVNAHIDYDTHFPPDYVEGHMRGLRLLRVAAAARDAHGRDVIGPLYTAMGSHIWDVEKPDDRAAHQKSLNSRDVVASMVDDAGLPTSLVDALDDPSWDDVIQADTDAALELTGKDVGTPIIQFGPPDGKAFFGPVLSRVPDDENSLRLWDLVTELAHFPSFAEMKRSLREPIQLRVFGRDPDAPVDAGPSEDWHQGSRRQKK